LTRSSTDATIQAMRARLLAALTPTDLILGGLAFIALAAIMFLAVTTRDIPAVLPTIVTTIIGFYVGSKTTRPAPPG